MKDVKADRRAWEKLVGNDAAEESNWVDSRQYLALEYDSTGRQALHFVLVRELSAQHKWATLVEEAGGPLKMKGQRKQFHVNCNNVTFYNTCTFRSNTVLSPMTQCPVFYIHVHIPPRRENRKF
jgi:hypothetical protein